MSLAIDPTAVTHVLLADGWHVTKNGIYLDAYEYVEGELPFEGKIVGFLAESPTGVSWTEAKGSVCCPLTSVLAVRVRPVSS